MSRRENEVPIIGVVPCYLPLSYYWKINHNYIFVFVLCEIKLEVVKVEMNKIILNVFEMQSVRYET